MKELCLIEAEKFSSLRSLDPCSIFYYYHNLISIWIFGVKLVPFERRLIALSNNIRNTKIRLIVIKLRPFKVGTDFQTQAAITIMRNRLNKGVSREVTILAIMFIKNTWEFVNMITSFLVEENVKPHLKPYKPFHYILNLIKTPSFALPPSRALKIDLVPFIFSPKFLQKFLEIGLNATGNNLGAGIFMVKPLEKDDE